MNKREITDKFNKMFHDHLKDHPETLPFLDEGVVVYRDTMLYHGLDPKKESDVWAFVIGVLVGIGVPIHRGHLKKDGDYGSTYIATCLVLRELMKNGK